MATEAGGTPETGYKGRGWPWGLDQGGAMCTGSWPLGESIRGVPARGEERPRVQDLHKRVDASLHSHTKSGSQCPPDAPAQSEALILFWVII